MTTRHPVRSTARSTGPHPTACSHRPISRTCAPMCQRTRRRCQAFIQQLRLIGGSVQQQLQQSGGRLGMSAEDQNTIIQVPYPKLNPTARQIRTTARLPDAKGRRGADAGDARSRAGGGGDSGLPSSLAILPIHTHRDSPAAPPAATTGPTPRHRPQAATPASAPCWAAPRPTVATNTAGLSRHQHPCQPLPVPNEPEQAGGTSTEARPQEPSSGSSRGGQSDGKPVPVPGGSGLVANPDGTVGPPRLPPDPALISRAACRSPPPQRPQPNVGRQDHRRLSLLAM